MAFEFIACQHKNHGVLILSEFIGAAQTLGSGAILVNPFNTDALAKAIYEALHMPEEERVERHQFMSEYVSKFTIQNWAENFVTELQTQEQEHEILTLNNPTPLPLPAVIETYKNSQRRLIILGLLGTLIEFEAFKNMEPLPVEIYKDLLALSSDPRNTVVVISGRERALVSQVHFTVVTHHAYAHADGLPVAPRRLHSSALCSLTARVYARRPVARRLASVECRREWHLLPARWPLR